MATSVKDSIHTGSDPHPNLHPHLSSTDTSGALEDAEAANLVKAISQIEAELAINREDQRQLNLDRLEHTDRIALWYVQENEDLKRKLCDAHLQIDALKMEVYAISQEMASMQEREIRT